MEEALHTVGQRMRCSTPAFTSSEYECSTQQPCPGSAPQQLLKGVLGVDVLRAVGQVVQRQQHLGALLRQRGSGAAAVFAAGEGAAAAFAAGEGAPRVPGTASKFMRLVLHVCLDAKRLPANPGAQHRCSTAAAATPHCSSTTPPLQQHHPPWLAARTRSSAENRSS